MALSPATAALLETAVQSHSDAVDLDAAHNKAVADKVSAENAEVVAAQSESDGYKKAANDLKAFVDALTVELSLPAPK